MSPHQGRSALTCHQEEHVVTICDDEGGTKITSPGHADARSPHDVQALIIWLAEASAISLVIPAAGDPVGLVGPPAAAAAAIEAGEALVVDHQGLWTVTASAEIFGSVWEPGCLVTWCLHPAPATVDRIPFNDPVQAQRELREAVLRAAHALAALDVAGARPSTRVWSRTTIR
jgi:hypothetical protein